MKIYYPKSLLIVSYLLICAFCNAQQKRAEIETSTAETDTIYAVDTIQLAPDPNLITLTKAEYDSIMQALNAKNNPSPPIEKKEKKKHWGEFNIVTADYLNIGIKVPYRFNNNYIYCIGGYNFNSYQPIIGGLSYCRKYYINSSFSINPEIQALFYFPTQKTDKIQNNNHLLVGIEYHLNKKISISMAPGCYVGWKSNVEDNAEYNQLIHIASPYKPIYTKETGAHSTFDFGYGFLAAISFCLN